MIVADANPLITFSAASTWSLPAEAATCVVSVQFDEDASLDAEFGALLCRASRPPPGVAAHFVGLLVPDVGSHVKKVP